MMPLSSSFLLPSSSSPQHTKVLRVLLLLDPIDGQGCESWGRPKKEDETTTRKITNIYRLKTFIYFFFFLQKWRHMFIYMMFRLATIFIFFLKKGVVNVKIIIFCFLLLPCVPLFGLLLRLLEWMSPQMAPSLEIILHSRKPQTNAGKEKKVCRFVWKCRRRLHTHTIGFGAFLGIRTPLE
jgi:hypothetical protein